MTMRRSINILLAIASVAAIGSIMFSYRNDAGGTQDVNVYSEIAGKVAVFRDGGDTLQSEYPPLASSLFFLVREKADIVGWDFSTMWLIVLFEMICIAVIAAFLRKRKDGAILAVSMLAVTALLGRELMFARFDVLIGVPLFFVMRLHADKRYPWSYALLAVAASLKLVPVLLLPLLILTTPKSAWKRSAVGAIAGVCISVIIPLIVLTPTGMIENVSHLLSYHGGRGMQLESTWSGLELLWRNLHGMESVIGFASMAAQNMAFGGAAVYIAYTAVILAVACIAWLSRTRRKTRAIPVQNAFIATIAITLACSPVLSPQFLVWLLLAAFGWYVMQITGMKTLRASLPTLGLLLIIGLGTHWVFPAHYGQLLDQSSLTTIAILNLRNAALFAFAFLLVKPYVPGLQKKKIRNRRRVFWIASALAVALIGTWGVLRYNLSLQTYDVRYAFSGEEAVEAEMPLFVPSKASPMDLWFTLDLSTIHATILRIKPDDCLELLSVNGVVVENNIIPYCDYGNGKTIDLSQYLQAGENDVHAIIRDDGGLGGMSIALDRADPVVLWIDLILFLALIGYGTVLAWLAGSRMATATAAIFTIGTVLRVAYFLVTPHSVRGHDTDAHIDYIQYVAHYFAIPPASDGWEFHQPPLYYFITGIWYAFGEMLGWTESLILSHVHVFSLVCGLITLAFGIMIARIVFPAKQDHARAVLMATLLAVWPSLIFVAARVSNDALYVPLMFGVIAFLLLWWKNGRLRDWYLSCILFSLTFLTKISVAALAPVFLICFLFRRGRSWKSKLLHSFLTLLLIGVSTLWLPAYRYFAEDNPTKSLTIGNDGMHSGLQTENTPENLLTFHPVKILQVPYNNPWNDDNRRMQYPEYLYRSAFFGEFGFADPLRPVSVALLLTGFLALLLSLIGVVRGLIRMPAQVMPHLLILLLLLASSVAYRWNFPYTSNQDFRFISAAIIPLSFFALLGSGAFGRREQWVRWILWLLAILGAAFIVLLYMTGG